MSKGQKITINSDGSLNVPNDPIIPFIEGDGTGPDIWRASRMVIDGAVRAAYGDSRKIEWMELLVGEKGFEQKGQWLSDEALAAMQDYVVSIKGPLTTPVGKGIRSLNVTIRQKLTFTPAFVRCATSTPFPAP